MINLTATPRILLLILSCLLGCPQKGIANDLLSDTFSLSPGRTAGQSLDLLPVETGTGAWKCEGKIVFDAEGGITPGKSGDAALAWVPLPAISGAKPVKLSADVKSEGKGYVILALLPDDDVSQFWQTVSLWVFFRPGGNWGVLCNGTTLVAEGTPEDGAFPFKDADFNHVELQYDPTLKTVRLTIDGQVVLSDKPVDATFPSSGYAVIRFNEPVTEKTCAVKNFSFGEAD